MHKYQHVFFDLDGTLTDSAPGIIRCMKHALEVMGFQDTGIDFTKYLGPPLTMTFTELLGEGRAEEAIKAYRARFQVKGMFENSLYDGVAEMLAQLQTLGYTMSIATSKPEAFAETILEHFNIRGFFMHVNGSLLDNSRQGKREVIAYAMNKAGCGRKGVLMVGDRHFDLHAAQELGIDAVGVLYGYGSYEELSMFRSVLLAKQPNDIVQFLS